VIGIMTRGEMWADSMDSVKVEVEVELEEYV